MNKKILEEINRTQEIMGLLVEQKFETRSGTLEDPHIGAIAPHEGAQEGHYYLNTKDGNIYPFKNGRYGNPIKPTTDVSVKKTTSDNTGGKVPRKEPRIRIKDLGGGKLQLVAKGEFPVNVTENNLSDIFIEKVVETIEDNERGKEILDSGNMNITFARVKSSASNYFNGPVKPTESNNLKEPVKLKDESYYTGNEEKNNKLALKRGQNLFLELEKKLPKKRINISAKPVFQQVITDTGGVYDELRDVKTHPRGGQFVTVKATLEIIPIEIVEEIRCLTDMKVTVGYYAKTSDLETAITKAEEPYKSRLKKAITHSQKLNQGREGSGGHQCNDAKFAVWLNNTKIGVVNLNNGGATPSQSGGGKDKFPQFQGGSRQGILTVKNSLATKIAKNTADKGGVVTFYLEPISTDSHSTVPWITIETVDKTIDGKTVPGKVLLDLPAEKISTYDSSRGSSGKFKVFGPFNPCEEIT